MKTKGVITFIDASKVTKCGIITSEDTIERDLKILRAAGATEINICSLVRLFTEQESLGENFIHMSPEDQKEFEIEYSWEINKRLGRSYNKKKEMKFMWDDQWTPGNNIRYPHRGDEINALWEEYEKALTPPDYEEDFHTHCCDCIAKELFMEMLNKIPTDPQGSYFKITGMIRDYLDLPF